MLFHGHDDNADGLFEDVQESPAENVKSSCGTEGYFVDLTLTVMQIAYFRTE